MRIALPTALCLLLGLLPGAAAAASKPPAKPTAEKGPPVCAAIHFRAVPAGTADGEQQAGMYRSRFSRLELMATVKGGAATDYHVTANGKPLEAAPQALPASAAACAAKKKLPAPAEAAASCTGDGFTVVIDHAGKERLALLYGRQGKGWQFCSAGSF
jgi:hypothetical protein